MAAPTTMPIWSWATPGIPHAAVPMAGLRGCDQAALFHLGRQLRYYKDFPKGANVNFYELIGPDHVYERTYERGVEDFTYACGTGTGSVVTVLTLLGKVSGKNVQVDMTGGRLVIDVERDAAGRVARPVPHRPHQHRLQGPDHR